MILLWISCLYLMFNIFLLFFFFFNDTATTEIYTLSLHDALPISTINYTASVTAPPASNSPYTNSVNINYTYVFPDGSNFTNSITSTNNLYPSNILVKPTLSLSADKYNVSTGDTINFTVLVSNNNSTTIENPE